MIAVSRQKSSKIATNFLETFANWLYDYPHVLGKGSHVLRLKIRLRPKPSKIKEMKDSRDSVAVLMVSGAGDEQANGNYKPAKKADGTYRKRDGTFVYRRTLSKNVPKRRYTICREKESKTGGRRWWICWSEQLETGKWSKSKDIYNVLCKKESSVLPPLDGWEVLKAGTAPAPIVNNQRITSSKSKKEDSTVDIGAIEEKGSVGSPETQNKIKNKKEYQLGTIASVPVKLAQK
eukprot:CAMPEP_0167742474 /NCGR_PEP_ID=MMETSP0110_2-20121227/1455_1 /TAXON_ID=629695 /ORGANISM="Gymnochlora sp., Strain CCMP2014" /LENGTH=233 /DNA_ID=CAMNT_0007626687 /DNA_START=1240 /DNA_END=1941 /DNA_ORIENTATION=+